MEPLQELFDLYESVVKKGQPKPQLGTDDPATISTPQRGQEDDPVMTARNQVDTFRLAGMSATDAHEKVHGEIDTADPHSKAEVAKTLGRAQADGDRKAVHVDKDAEFKSLLAKDEELEDKIGRTTEGDEKTPLAQEVPDRLEAGVDTNEEFDYNDDVAYINQYGRK